MNEKTKKILAKMIIGFWILLFIVFIIFAIYKLGIGLLFGLLWVIMIAAIIFPLIWAMDILEL